jgi:dephospho-CoA kinase
MTTAGLTGGLGSGKTFIANVFAELGCHVIHADQLGHRALEPSGEAFAAVVAHFGSSILSSSGAIDRRALAQIVFNDSEQLAALNAIVHPVVFRLEMELIAQGALEDPSGIAIVEAAILIETGNYENFDFLILAVCSEEQQIERAMARDRLSREQVLQRMARQMPLQKKREYADFIIDTSGTTGSTRKQTEQVYEVLRSRE